MTLYETAWWYLGNVLEYILQMLPCMAVGVVGFLLLRPFRLKRLQGKGLVSPAPRELALLLYVMFCAGLAALTLFPANLWSWVTAWLLSRDYWTIAWSHRTLASFYPTWEQTLAALPHLPDMLQPFQEIRRALGHMSPWLMFMLLGNIAMFVPLGFFPALLWRRWRWWKALLLGFFSSCAIEFIQFFIGRSTDIDDVILNTTGALLGFALYALCRAAFPRLTAKFHCRPKGEGSKWTN